MINELKTIKEFKDWLIFQKIFIDKKYKYLQRYIDLLDQPLKLEMFVPCLDGVPLEEPEKLDQRNPYLEAIHVNTNRRKWVEYQQAEERVLFDGFEYENHELKRNDGIFWIGRFNYSDKISGLLNHWTEIKLTNNFKKLITG